MTLAKTSIDFLQYADVSKRSSNKGWTYSYVYFFKELRDVYLIIKENVNKSKKDLYHLISLNVIPEGQTWNDRRILEQVNALINFGLINKRLDIEKLVFCDSIINSDLSKEDKLVFKEIFFSYQRFKDFEFLFFKETNHHVFLGSEEASTLFENCVNNTSTVYAFSQNNKYLNSFLVDYKLITIPDSHKHIMRFWDVFIKWGRALDLLEKIALPIELLPRNEKAALECFDTTINIVYFKSNLLCDKYQIEYCINKYSMGKYIYIPSLIVALIIETRCSLNSIKEAVISFYLSSRESISIERTSEVFIDKLMMPLFPIFNSSFVSHLLLKKI